MRIALAQMDIAWEQPEANLIEAARYARAARDQDADLIVFPEMMTTGFSMNPSLATALSDSIGLTALADIAKEQKMAVIAGLALSSDPPGRGKNSAVAFNANGRQLAIFTKLHPFSPAGEDAHFPGGGAPLTFEVAGAMASIFICYDLRFPEDWRRVARDVSLFIVPANWPGSRQTHWEALLMARAIENQAFVVGINRVGVDRNNISYAGGSRAYGPTGELLADAGPSAGLETVEIELDEAIKVRERFPFLNDMRDLDR